MCIHINSAISLLKLHIPKVEKVTATSTTSPRYLQLVVIATFSTPNPNFAPILNFV